MYSNNVIKVKERLGLVNKRIEDIRREQLVVDRLKENFEQILANLNVKKSDIEAEIEVLEKSLKLFKEISDERNKSAKEAMETVVNWSLSKIFTNQSYDVKIKEDSDARSGKVMEIYLIDNHSGKSRSLKHQLGTAMVQIISFLMMLTVIKFAGSSKVLILDEIFSGLEDKEAITMFSEILVSLAKNEGFQIFIVEQNSLISENDDFVRINVALENQDDGLIIKSIDKK